MLSVLSTPCTKPAANHSAPRPRDGADDAVAEAGDRVGRVGGVGPVVGDRVVDQAAQRRRLVEGGEALEGAEADVAVAEPDQHRRAGRGGLVAAGRAPRRSRSARRSSRCRRRAPRASRWRGSRARRPSASAGRRRSATRAWCPSPWCRGRAGGRRRGRAAGRRGSRGRRRGRGCRRGTGGRGSAAPAAPGGCRAAARSGRSGAIHSSSERSSRPSARPSGRCGSAAGSRGSRPGGRGRRSPAPSAAWICSGRKRAGVMPEAYARRRAATARRGREPLGCDPDVSS